MIGRVQSIATNNIVSPFGLALVSSGIFLLAWAAPPDLFLNYAGEPDFLYHNPQVLLFYGCCVIAFVGGVRAFEALRPFAAEDEQVVSSGIPLTFLLLPLFVSTALCAASVVVLNGKVSNLGGLMFSQQGALIKLAGASGQAEEGSWGYALIFHTGVLWWAWSRSRQLLLSRSFRWIFRICFMTGLALGLLTAFIKVDRTNLIPIIIGLLVIHLYNRLSTRDVSLARLAAICIGFAVVVLAVFLAISYVRGASDLRLAAAGVFGYSAASYNRLAAELKGLLHYSYGGRGIYLSTFISFNNTLNKLLPFNQWMGAPTQHGVYFSEFSSIAASGLNPAFNWSGAFGYIYADLGWWTPFYLFAVGVINGYLWRAFRAKRLAGIVLYPWAAFSILFWFGWNIFFDLRATMLAVLVVTLGCYEFCMSGVRSYSAFRPKEAVA